MDFESVVLNMHYLDVLTLQKSPQTESCTDSGAENEGSCHSDQMSNDFSTDDAVDEGICLDNTSSAERVLKPKVTSCPVWTLMLKCCIELWTMRDERAFSCLPYRAPWPLNSFQSWCILGVLRVGTTMLASSPSVTASGTASMTSTSARSASQHQSSIRK